MATEAQIHANRANSEHSSGPTTEQGKATSSRNRLSHGFASSTRFIKGEDPEEFYALLDDLIGEHAPATPTEQILVERMAHHQWISLRANRVQGELLAGTTDFKELHDHLPLLIRYQTTADRAFHKSYNELLRAKKQRGNSEIGFESKKVVEPAAAPLESTKKSLEKPPAPPAEPRKIDPLAPVDLHSMSADGKIRLGKDP